MSTLRPTYTYRPRSRSSVPVVIYGTGWCAASQIVRRHLDRLRVPYIFRDMELDLAAARQVQWWTGGSFSHPTVQIGGQILVEPGLDELDWVLSRVGVL